MIVADDGSRDRTAARGRGAPARASLRLPRRGKGQALTLAEREAPPGPLLLCDADLTRRPAAAARGATPTSPSRRSPSAQGGGFGIAKRTARALIRAADRASSCASRSPASARCRRERAQRCFPLAAGFGCEARMTVDALEAGLTVEEVELPLRHRATGRDVRRLRAPRPPAPRRRCSRFGPLGVNHRGLRLPLVGWVRRPARAARSRRSRRSGSPTTSGAGPERGVRDHLRAGRTTGVLKLVGIPLVGLLATRRLSGALLVGLAANALNQLDTKPGRALKAYALAAVPLRAPLLPAVLLLPTIFAR